MLKVFAPETHWLSADMPKLARIMNAPGIENAEIMIGEGLDGQLSVQVHVLSQSEAVAKPALDAAYELLTGSRESFVRVEPTVEGEQNFERDVMEYRGRFRATVFNRQGARKVLTAERIDTPSIPAVSNELSSRE